MNELLARLVHTLNTVRPDRGHYQIRYDRMGDEYFLDSCNSSGCKVVGHGKAVAMANIVLDLHDTFSAK